MGRDGFGNPNEGTYRCILATALVCGGDKGASVLVKRSTLLLVLSDGPALQAWAGPKIPATPMRIVRDRQVRELLALMQGLGLAKSQAPRRPGLFLVGFPPKFPPANLLAHLKGEWPPRRYAATTLPALGVSGQLLPPREDSDPPLDDAWWEDFRRHLLPGSQDAPKRVPPRGP